MTDGIRPQNLRGLRQFTIDRLNQHCPSAQPGQLDAAGILYILTVF